jgi:hypothetical protein
MIATAADAEVFAVAGQGWFVVVASAAAKAEEKTSSSICYVFAFTDGALVVLFDMGRQCCAVGCRWTIRRI